MNILLENLPYYANAFILVLIRVTSLFILSPIFGRKNMPNIMKIGFGVIVSFIIIPTIDVNSIKQYDHILQYVLVILNDSDAGSSHLF